MAEIQEFAVAAEVVTATMTLPLSTGEHFGPPFTIGFYPGQAEIWIEGEHGRQNIPAEHLNQIIKQLRRAAKLAAENTKDDT
ncbi:hypothetical protein CSC67_08440 [Pusillimonas caeni]|uniref:hypothetical protein n=1 Tax=Pusillimonas caeni TaxID=1348472 RepID=UPI000E59DD52|nr:hypothetical protein [Pusillimonas caeni]TFL14171.1 hypothetical protein CSC67_08440 [Pusillimonas caeni]